MFSKKGSNILIAFLFFIIGSILSYILCQYSYLDINLEFNIVEILLSTATIGIGLYIALVFDKNRAKSQNLYAFIETKYDTLWEIFIQFSLILELSRNVELSEISKKFKSLDKKLTPLIKIVESNGHQSDFLKNLETRIDELENLISNSNNITNNIVDLSIDRDIIDDKLQQINELFAKSFKEINNL
ncbi:hypothetical protein [uncultured Zobellia sp.]|uniref:hypothetical protein n=1 Tax=uncultured Zobellia sp. TaxID=255433 RepID=UPI0025942A5E|nr:hypothetical protein [uncultured Zobellia sp.]